jgi:hypothetical protein
LGKRRVRRLRRVISKVFLRSLLDTSQEFLALTTQEKKETKTPVGRVAPDALPCNSGAYLRQVGDEGARLGSGQYRTASIVEVALE